MFLVALMIGSATGESIFSSYKSFSTASVEAMEQAFSRSEKLHAESMAAIMKSMSAEGAWTVVEKHNLSNPALVEVSNLVHGKQSSLRKHGQPKGYAGLDGARKLLNDMIYESMSKYDAEIAKCTEYYAEQCAAMETCRGKIAAANFIAANSRTLILDAQARINRCEVSIPTMKLELKLHNEKCARELHKMKSRLAVILADIEVMTIILKMTDCKKKALLQERKSGVLRCVDACTKTAFVTFQDDKMKQQISQLKSEASQKLIKDTFADLFEGVESLESVELLQLDSAASQSPLVNKTQFNNPPVPRTQVPSDPCTDPNGGAPSAATKRAAKCSIGKSPQCYKLQERFLLIQAGIKDDRDALLEDIADMEKNCEDVKNNLEKQIADDQDILSDAQTKLGFATEKEATAGETARTSNDEHDQFDRDLRKQMKTCTQNYINFETEICALKKIRGELMKMKGDGHSGFFQDCEVSKWDPEECTKKCQEKGRPNGEQKLTRSVLTHPNGGTKCLPLSAMKKCNLHPCPVDCALDAWTGWSKCSAECGGGVQQRLREVKRAMRYGGKACGATSETRSCHITGCEKDCVLSKWTRWSKCSKDCDGGTRKRQKFIVEAAQGSGKCASKWSKDRLEYRKCNMQRCVGETLKCNETLDVVFLIDGSGSLGSQGWAAEIKAAEMFVNAFSGTGAQAEMSVILYSGPRTWSGVRMCTGKNSKKVDLGKFCMVKTVTHFEKDMNKVKSVIKGLTWPRGSTLTSLALMTAKAELSLGRKEARSVVVVITDGRPLSYRNTYIASWNLRKKARLVWVPVTRYAPLAQIKSWATRRWQENVVTVKTFNDLKTPAPVNHVIANICPETNPEMKFGRR